MKYIIGFVHQLQYITKDRIKVDDPKNLMRNISGSVSLRGSGLSFQIVWVEKGEIKTIEKLKVEFYELISRMFFNGNESACFKWLTLDNEGKAGNWDAPERIFYRDIPCQLMIYAWKMCFPEDLKHREWTSRQIRSGILKLLSYKRYELKCKFVSILAHDRVPDCLKQDTLFTQQSLYKKMMHGFAEEEIKKREDENKNKNKNKKVDGKKQNKRVRGEVDEEEKERRRLHKQHSSQLKFHLDSIVDKESSIKDTEKKILHLQKDLKNHQKDIKYHEQQIAVLEIDLGRLPKKKKQKVSLK